MITFLLASCSSAKKSKKGGGGWYQNRNVNQQKTDKQKTFVYQPKEYFQKKTYFDFEW